MSEVGSEAKAKLARVLREARARKGVKEQVLADRAGLSRTGVSRILHGHSLPRRANLVALADVLGLEPGTVLALRERAVSAEAPIARHTRGGRTLGRFLADLGDQDAIEYLQVHRSIIAGGPVSGLLPPYITRRHDHLVAGLVEQSRSGCAMAMLVGSSSSGKTRCLWEVLTPLRTAERGWRLWRPAQPGDLVHGLSSGLLAARTVVWLNDSYEFFSAPEGEHAAALILENLLQRARPLLIVGTLWNQQFAALTQRPAPAGPDPHRNARALLDGRCIVVEPEFTDQDMRVLAELAPTDSRLQLARELGGREITQFLAGAREILARYEAAPPGAAALADAANDARRLGHGRLIPRSFLIHAAPGYLTDNQWQLLPDDWEDEAFAYLAQECKGVPGPLTAARAYPGQQSPAAPACQLSDFLEQVGAFTRSWLCPPDEFWQAARTHAATDDDRHRLALAARERARYTYARLLYETAPQREVYNLAIMASHEGDSAEVERLLQQAGDHPVTTDLRIGQALDAGDDATASLLLKDLADLNWPNASKRLGDIAQRAGRRDEAIRQYQQAAGLGDLDGMQALASLYFDDGKLEEARELYERAAELGDVNAYSVLAHQYLRIGKLDEGERYLRKAISAGLVDCYLILIRAREQADGRQAAKELRKEAVEMGEVTLPMLEREHVGDYDAAEEIALDAAGRNYVLPLRALLGERLRRGAEERAADLGQRACDAGHAYTVRGICDYEQEEFGTQVLRQAVQELDQIAQPRR